MSAVLERLFLNLIATAVLYGLKNTILYVDLGTKYEGVRFDRRLLQIILVYFELAVWSKNFPNYPPSAMAEDLYLHTLRSYLQLCRTASSEHVSCQNMPV